MKLLEGIKVVEFATFVVVPAATRVLADWGAEVIKIEAASGDEWRKQSAAYGLPCDDTCNPIFAATNSGKQFVSLNLKTPEGKEVLFRLLEDADVFVTNIRWDSIVRLGLDYETLHKMFPELIYMHFSGFGYEGPYKDRPGFDSAAFWASTGALYEISEKGSHPMYPPGAFGDTATSNCVVSGITAALFHRQRTGEGMQVTTSLYANGIWCNHSHIIACQERPNGSTPPSYPRSFDEATNPFRNIYQCKDGRWMLLATYHVSRFIECMRVFGLDKYNDDPNFANECNASRFPRELRDMFVEVFKTKTAAEWDKILTENGIVHQELLNSSDVSKDEQAWSNDYVSRVNFPNGEEYVLPKSPLTFSGMERTPSQPVGGIGSDTVAIMKKCGYTPEQIQDYLTCGIASAT